MADFDNDQEPDAAPDDEPTNEQAAAFEAELQRQMELLPPGLYENLKPLLLLGSVANYMLLSYPNDPVPQALKELLDYDLDTLKIVLQAQDTTSLGRVIATHSLQLFDFMLVGRLVFESALAEPLHAYLTQSSDGGEEFTGPHDYMLNFGTALLEGITQSLAASNPEAREELHMRRLQTESIFARLDETLRPYYPPGHSPAEQQANALDAADEAEDQAEPAVHVSFNQVQRVTLGTALRLPPLLADLGETPFARALATLPRLRRNALERLAARLATTPPDEPIALSWSELLRLYQAAQVCALSTVTDVLATGSLEDFMFNNAAGNTKPPEEAAANAHRTRELMTMVMTGFVEVIEANHPNDEEIIEAKAEISQLTELLLE